VTVLFAASRSLTNFVGVRVSPSRLPLRISARQVGRDDVRHADGQASHLGLRHPPQLVGYFQLQCDLRPHNEYSGGGRVRKHTVADIVYLGRSLRGSIAFPWGWSKDLAQPLECVSNDAYEPTDVLGVV
jgi:hypothetical protein